MYVIITIHASMTCDCVFDDRSALFVERFGWRMELLTLENSSLTEEDLLLTEIKQEIDDEVY